MPKKPDPDVDLSLVSNEDLARELTSRFDVAFFAGVKRMALGREELVHAYRGQHLEVLGLMDFMVDLCRRQYAKGSHRVERPVDDEDE